MSEITKPIMLNETGQLIADGIARQNLLLTELVASSGQATPVSTLNEIASIVRAGNAENVFDIGDQIHDRGTILVVLCGGDKALGLVQNDVDHLFFGTDVLAIDGNHVAFLNVVTGLIHNNAIDLDFSGQSQFVSLSAAGNPTLRNVLI